jgi:hypothetical protein
MRVLHFDRDDHGIFYDSGNERKNVSLIVRSCHEPLESYRDLDFVIPEAIHNPDTMQAITIPKTFIYADSIPVGTNIIHHLESLLPASLQGVGLIRPFSACASSKYRSQALRDFKDGKIRILVCTDAAGMVRQHHNNHIARTSSHYRDAIYLTLI